MVEQYIEEAMQIAADIDLEQVCTIMYEGFNKARILTKLGSKKMIDVGLGLAIIASFRGVNAAKIKDLKIPGVSMTVGQAMKDSPDLDYKAGSNRISLSQLMQTFSMQLLVIWIRLYRSGLLPPSSIIPNHPELACAAFISLPLIPSLATQVETFYDSFSASLQTGTRQNQTNVVRGQKIKELQIASRSTWSYDEIFNCESIIGPGYLTYEFCGSFKQCSMEAKTEAPRIQNTLRERTSIFNEGINMVKVSKHREKSELLGDITFGSILEEKGKELGNERKKEEDLKQNLEKIRESIDKAKRGELGESDDDDVSSRSSNDSRKGQLEEKEKTGGS